ncbi:circularly permuted type 2 ATP-grasp protein [Bacillus sp. 03113]|uniref:circularly permuted type 2 ATP-grasp protein n=1 Tax=Bacillus sp. 03113 TaxID=2578211 RepID=UPI001142FD66|nr:circularly permuted type 2 ATP-grasp protein [Bacillus sp. 03113]
MIKEYDVAKGFYDEMFAENNEPHEHYQTFLQNMSGFTEQMVEQRHQLAQQNFLRQGITFTVYNNLEGTERTMPFDPLPRIIPKDEWEVIEKGLKQRILALNAFLEDVYTKQEIFEHDIVPRDLVVTSADFAHQVYGVNVPKKNHIFLAGIDLIRDKDGNYLVLEDNVRNPSGLSYVFQNRFVMRKIFPEVFGNYSIQSLENQIHEMHQALKYICPNETKKPTIVLLTPGVYNSAYYDHSFLAKQMGIELVESRDLFVKDRVVYMKTIRGLKQVDVVYRRIDDDFLDPLEFREDSMIGVPGLLDAYRAGNVAIANGIGNGVADDKATYAYVPDMIRFYLKEEPILQNVKTYLLKNKDDYHYALEHLDELVFKERNSSGGYNMLIGPHATEEEKEEYRKRIIENPENFIAQPTISLSKLPTYTDEGVQGRHVDLRAFVVLNEKPQVVPGGLTRVALTKGSLVVNSSQGGGSKDTWVLE